MGEFCKTTVLPMNQTFPHIPFINASVSALMDVCREIEISKFESATQAKYSEPMVAIGAYIAIASIVCTFFMMRDVVVSILYNFWFPSYSFSLNAVSITLIALAMKLPLDLSSPMSNEMDQVAKVGSLCFMCIMMSHLMPSLASMDNNSILANVTGLSMLVIGIIVNVDIEIKTQVITRESFNPSFVPIFIVAYIYMGMLLCLQVIFISYATTIPGVKKVLEFKYQATLNHHNPQKNFKLTADELQKILNKYCIMAETSSPDFLMSPLTFTTSVICAKSMVLYIFIFWHAWKSDLRSTSVYKGSTIGICAIQFLGVVGGVVGSIYKSCVVLRFKGFSNLKKIKHSMIVIESYWTQTMCVWKEMYPDLVGRIIYDSGRLGSLKNKILSIFIAFHKVIVVSCKLIEYIPLNQMVRTLPPASSSEDIEDRDLRKYVLSLEDDVQVIKYSLKRCLDALNMWTWIDTIKPDYNILNLLEKSNGFKGVEMFDTEQIQYLLPDELVDNSWSLPIISLTCIAIAIPNVVEDAVDNLLKSVHEGLSFTRIVEESLHTKIEYLSTRRATMALWRKVRDKRKWLDTTLKISAYQGKAPIEIVKSFAYAAENILNEYNENDNGEFLRTNHPSKVIIANTMYKTAQAIMRTYEINSLKVIEDELFSRLSTTIADIFAACLTNIPRVMIKTCHDSTIENRKFQVLRAFRLLEETRNIIKKLETRELPNMDPNRMAYIDEWRLHFRQP